MRTIQSTVVIFFIILGVRAHAQEVFSSIVVDSASFTPMPYVSVSVKHRNMGAITNEKGSFTIRASRADTLIFSFVGYTSFEYPLQDWEAGLIRLGEKKIILKNVTVQSTAINPYQGMFDDENAKVAARHNKFYYSKQRKEKRKLIWLKEDNIKAQTYVDVVINSSELKDWLMSHHKLNEAQYYKVLGEFNEKNAEVMYYITAGELVTLIKNFYALKLQQR